MSHKQEAEYYLASAQILKERLERIESQATAAVLDADPHLAGRLIKDPGDLAAKNELSYRVGLRMEKYTHAIADLASVRNRNVQWALAHGILALMEVMSSGTQDHSSPGQ